MATFVIETYLSRARSAALEDIAARLRAEIVRADADPEATVRVVPRYLRSFYVSADEIAYHIIEIGSAEAAAELSRAAGLAPERIVEAKATAG